MNNICLSVVSHRQGALVNLLLSDIARLAPDMAVCVTENVPEESALEFAGLRNLHVIRNPAVRGFASNHNAAFATCQYPFFCVVNPDVRLLENIFPSLLTLLQDPRIGLVVPQVVSPQGVVENNVRHFPTLSNLLLKSMGLRDGHIAMTQQVPQEVDWAAGMFMLFRADTFRAIGGFDEKYFLYYEDVDICVRLWQSGWKVMYDPRVSIVHAAQRMSHKHPRYLTWHISSMGRYFYKHLGRLPSIKTNL